MIVLLRSLVVYCMLLALPYQGYAAAAMMACWPDTSAATASAPASAVLHRAMPTGAHDHAAMMAAMGQQSSPPSASSDSVDPSAFAHADNAATHADHHPGQTHGQNHGSAKCGGSACCIAGAPVLATMLGVPALPAVSNDVALYSEYLPAVDLAHPERPPQA